MRDPTMCAAVLREEWTIDRRAFELDEHRFSGSSKGEVANPLRSMQDTEPCFAELHLDR